MMVGTVRGQRRVEARQLFRHDPEMRDADGKDDAAGKDLLAFPCRQLEPISVALDMPDVDCFQPGDEMPLEFLSVCDKGRERYGVDTVAVGDPPVAAIARQGQPAARP